MPRNRNWKFTAGNTVTSEVLNSATDFWIEHSWSGAPAKATIILHGVWERFITEVDPLKRRTAIENALLSLNQLVGRSGTLQIDYGKPSPRPKSFSGYVLEQISVVNGSSSKHYEVDLTFSVPTAGMSGVTRSLTMVETNISATETKNFRGLWESTFNYFRNDMVSHNGYLYLALQGNFNQEPKLLDNAIWTKQIQSQLSGISYFVVNEVAENTNQFSRSWRANPVRIAGGIGLRDIILTAVLVRPVPSTDSNLARRVAVEGEISLMQDRVGKEFILSTDSKSYNNCCLHSVNPNGSLELPDSVSFDMTFKSGYINA